MRSMVEGAAKPTVLYQAYVRALGGPYRRKYASASVELGCPPP